MWPALMFAASRNDRVAGRTVTLLDSISTRNGFSHRGAPLGSRAAKNFIGALQKEDRIRVNHMTKPKESVSSRWLEELKVYGTRPMRFRSRSIRNIGVMRAFHPVS